MAVATRDWEATLREWARPSSDTEGEKCERAERMIRSAINLYPGFTGSRPKVYAKGSYANNTNVRLDSDVDVVVEWKRAFYYDGRNVPSFTPAAANIVSTSDQFGLFKLHVHVALIKKFGVDAIDPGNKAFDVHENTARVDADVVPCWEYRQYYGRGPEDFVAGTLLIADDGKEIVNWPAQQRIHGNRKNVSTAGRYKFLTRSWKRLRNEMVARGIPAAVPIRSYLIECLLYNVPDEDFAGPSFLVALRRALAEIVVRISADWVEVNNLKWLFADDQPWTLAQAKSFALSALIYLDGDA